MNTLRARLRARATAPEVGTLPARVAIAGATGSGKSTLARRLGQLYSLPYIEMDGLYYGPRWTPRDDFTEKATAALSGDRWITDSQYAAVSPVLIARAQLLIWLDYPAPLTWASLVLRTLLRRLHHETLWAGNREAGLLSFLWDRQHAFRYGLRGDRAVVQSLTSMLEEPIGKTTRFWRFSSPAQLSQWLETEQQARGAQRP